MILIVGNIIKIEYNFTYEYIKYTEIIVGEIVEIVDFLGDEPEIIKIEQIIDYERYIKEGIRSNIFRTFRVKEVDYDFFPAV